MAKDYVGNEIEVGDTVVFVQLGYRNFWEGIIAKITPKTLLIDHERTNTCSTQTKQFHNQVIKYDKVDILPRLKS